MAQETTVQETEDKRNTYKVQHRLLPTSPKPAFEQRAHQDTFPLVEEMLIFGLKTLAGGVSCILAQ